MTIIVPSDVLTDPNGPLWTVVIVVVTDGPRQAIGQTNIVE